MSKNIRLILLIVSTVILEVSILPLFPVSGISLSLIGLSVTALTLLGFVQEALVVAIIGGGLLDLLAPPPFGVQTLVFTASWGIFALISRHRLITPRIVVVGGSMALVGALLALPQFLVMADLLMLISSTFLHASLGVLLFKAYILLFPRPEPIKV